MVGLKGQGSTSEKREKAAMEIKVCGGTLKVSEFVKNTSCKFVLDIGADITILCSWVFLKLDSNRIAKFKNDGVIRGLDRQVIPVTSRVTLEITLGETLLNMKNRLLLFKKMYPRCGLLEKGRLRH